MIDDNIEWIETENEEQFRQQIFATDDRQEVLVPVPEWKRKVLIKRLSGRARSEFIAFQIALEQSCKNDRSEYFRRLWFELARLGCVHPKTKKPIFKILDRDTWTDEHDGAVIETLGRTVQTFSQLDGSVAEQAKKNLASIQNTTTTTNSLNGAGVSV
jgi:hypothetical protein